MCGFTTTMFGAPYPDAECVDGYMWDLDSYDNGYLTSGGEIPCPKCNTAKWLEDILSDATNEIPQSQNDPKPPAYVWEKAVLYALKINPSAARAYLRNLKPFELLDHKDRVSSPSRPWEDAAEYEADNFVWRLWPWPILSMSQHERLAISPQT